MRIVERRFGLEVAQATLLVAVVCAAVVTLLDAVEVPGAPTASEWLGRWFATSAAHVGPVLPLAAAIGAGQVVRRWSRTGAWVGAMASATSPRQMAIAAGLGALVAILPPLAGRELALHRFGAAADADGRWVEVVDGDDRLFLRAASLAAHGLRGVELARIEHGELIEVGQVEAGSWRGGQWQLDGAIALQQALPPPERWLSASVRPGPRTSLVRIWRSSSSRARTAWLAAAAIAPVGAMVAGGLAVASSRRGVVPWLGSLIAIGLWCVFSGQVVDAIAVGRWPAAAFLALGFVGLVPAWLALGRLDAYDGSAM